MQEAVASNTGSHRWVRSTSRTHVPVAPRPAGRLHSVVLSDIHLADAEPLDPKRPMWKAFKRREHFVDADVARLLAWTADQAEMAGDSCEVVFNGDVFDFDPITALPDPPPSKLRWLARARGLGTEEWCSHFKMSLIVADHPEFFGAVGDFVRRGHRVVFVTGNHDLELCWPSVQAQVREALHLDAEAQPRVRFCEWFYLSDGDVYISHGHQADPYCVVPDPIHPLIDVRGKPTVRLPFGDVANRYMLNGMGYFNPHATANYIMSGADYVRFFLKYMVRDQPLLIVTWFWSAAVTLLVTVAHFLRPSLRDPLTVEDKVAGIAERANATPAMVRQLAAAHTPSACTNPSAIIRELWLDRGVLFLVMVWVAWTIVMSLNLVWPISPLWVLLPLSLLFPLFLAYSFRVKPETFAEPLLTERSAQWIHRITGVRMAVMGHTHIPEMSDIGPIRFCNAGFWSPAFTEPECRTRIGTQTFAWVTPTEEGERHLALMEWPPGAETPRPLATTDPAIPVGEATAALGPR